MFKNSVKDMNQKQLEMLKKSLAKAVLGEIFTEGIDDLTVEEGSGNIIAQGKFLDRGVLPNGKPDNRVYVYSILEINGEVEVEYKPVEGNFSEFKSNLDDEDLIIYGTRIRRPVILSFGEGKGVDEDWFFNYFEEVSSQLKNEILLLTKNGKILDFKSTDSTGKKKERNCKVGQPCKGVCISTKKTCRDKPETESAKKSAKVLKKVVKNEVSDEEFAKELDALAAELGLVDSPAKEDSTPKTPEKEDPSETPKQEESKGTLQEGSKTEFARKWESSWDEAPDDLKDVLKVIDEPGEITEKQNSGAFYRGGTGNIYMAGLERGHEGDLIYRHEYGHHIDELAVKTLGTKKLDEEARKVGYESLDAIYKDRDESDDPSKAKEALSKLKEASGFKSDDLVSRKDLEEGILGVGKDGYISSGKTYVDATRKDEDRLLSRKNESDEAFIKVKNENSDFLEKNKNNVKVKALTSPPPSKEKEAALGELIATKTVESEISDRMRAEIINTKFKGKEPKSTAQKQKLESELSLSNPNAQALRRKVLTDMASETLKTAKVSDPLTSDLMKEAKPENMMVSDVVLLRYSPKDPRATLALAGNVTDARSVIQDLAGAVTLNKLGGGHSDSYYAGMNRRRYTEAFAQLNTIHGMSKNNPLARRVLEEIAPNSYNAYKGILNDIVSARTT